MKLKGRRYKTVVRSALLYGRNVGWSRRVRNRRCVRFCGTMTRNERIKGIVGVINIGEKTREDQLRSFGHVTRWCDEDLVKVIQGL